ncbi:hypothetical protein D9Q98_003143 [Chlorella vulgaris]|uniref:Uncharacterized protein n=1 Tax=Chlorella vulgaris TaxID=3077 RepID=A0A9D4YZ54_CHLVU|nr:hypothetical protein D9Q98_003143 [Chlorella vulgaris]
MLSSLSCPKAPACAALPRTARRGARLARPVCATPREDPREQGDYASHIIDGEWTPTISWSLPSTPVRHTSPPASVPAPGSAADEGADVAGVFSGDWDGRSCSLASYEDVMVHYNAMRHPEKK